MPGIYCRSFERTELGVDRLAINRDKRIQITHYSDNFGYTVSALNGTPSDCINIALAHLVGDQPDIVVSGINITHNVSTLLMFSPRTVVGPIEGVCWGIPSVSFSHFVPKEDRPLLRENHRQTQGKILESFNNTVLISAKIAQETLSQPFKDYVFKNVNFPMDTTLETEIYGTKPAPTLYRLNI